MTVFNTEPTYSQYTGTGARVFFEYDWDWAGEPVYVEVDGIPVTFTQQDSGVVLDTAPELNAVIFIYRKTDITQERNFAAFDEFRANWTEDALDKLILLKQEAGSWRARLNLFTDRNDWRVQLVNDKGTNPIIALWNTDMAGVFSGEVTETPPGIGSYVYKPEDFAYFFWQGEPPPPVFPTEEYLILGYPSSTEGTVQVHYVYNSGSTITAIDSIPYTTWPFVCSDGTHVFMSSTGGWPDLQQLGWNGTGLFTVLDGPTTLNNDSGCQVVPGETGRLIVVDTNSRQMSTLDYESSAPFAYSNVINTATTGDGDGDVCFFRTGDEKFKPGVGTVMAVGTANIYTDQSFLFTVESGVAVVKSLSVNNQGFYGDGTYTGYDMDYGYSFQALQFTTDQFYIWEHDIDGLTHGARIGPATIDGDEVYSVTGIHGLVVTFERDNAVSTSKNRIRTYSRVGTTLTLLDDYEFPGTGLGPGHPNAKLVVSPYTNNVYCLGNLEGNFGCFSVAANGDITLITDGPFKAWNASGSMKNNIQFLLNPLTITSP